MSIFKKLFKKSEKTDTAGTWIRERYERMKPEYREGIFYGGAENAEEIITSMAERAFQSKEKRCLELSFDIYLHVWIRSHGDTRSICSTPGYIKKNIKDKYVSVPVDTLHKCVDITAEFMYAHEPELEQKDRSLEAREQMVQECAQQNTQIEEVHLNDADYGLVVGKPVFAAGFEEARFYLARLRTADNQEICHNRRGSICVNGIAGPVDIYEISVMGNVKTTIYICNYGTKTSRKAPAGFMLR